MLPHRIEERKEIGVGEQRMRSSASSQAIRRLFLSTHHLLGLLLLLGNPCGHCWGFQNLHHSPRSSSSTSTFGPRLGATGNGNDLGFSQASDESRNQKKKPLLKKVLGAVKPNRWRKKDRHDSYALEGKASSDDDNNNNDDDDEDEKESSSSSTREAAQKDAIARLKAEVESKRAAEKKDRWQAEQDDKLKRAEAEVARLRAEAKARQEAEEAAARAEQQEAEEKRKAAAAAEQQKRAEAEKKRAQDVATLLKAKEEAARVMAEIDAKLRAETARADEEEAERVARLQVEASESPPALDDADDELLARMMEEMEKVRIELDSRIQAEAEEQQKQEQEQQRQKEEEDEKAKTLGVGGGLSPDLMARIQSGASYEHPAPPSKRPPTPADKEKETETKEAAVPPQKAMPDLKPPVSKSDKAPLEATASDEEEASEPVPPSPPPPKMPMPDLTPPSSAKKTNPETNAADSKSEKSKPKWMVDWKAKATSNEQEEKLAKTESKTKDEVEAPETTKFAIEEKEELKEEEEEEEKVEAATEEKVEVKASEEDESTDQPDRAQPKKDNKDPRTVGRSSRENLFDVIGRTAGSTITLDEMTDKKKKAAQQQQQKQKEKQKRPSPEPLKAEVMNDLKDRGPPASFGESVAASYKTGGESKRTIPSDLFNKNELKKKGPPADFGSFAAAASGQQGSRPQTPRYEVDKGPPASFGASVAMASSGDVPQDLLSRGTASTDAGVSNSRNNPSKSSSKQRNDDSNIIDVVDVVYTKKDEPTKPKKTPAAKKKSSPKTPPKETVIPPPPPPMNNAPPLKVEKKVPPIRNEPKAKKEEEPKTQEAPVAEPKTPSRPVNIGKATAENSPIFGKRKTETDTKEPPKEETESKPTNNAPETKSEKKEKAMEDRVADLLKEAFSLSKEDSRVADLLQGVVSITTGTDKKGESVSATKSSAKGRKMAVTDDDDDDDDDDDIKAFDPVFEDDDEEFDDDEEGTAIMGRTRKRQPMQDPNGFRINNDQRPKPPPRRRPLNTRIESTPVENEWGDDGFIETPISSDEFDDYDGDGYFEDDESDYFEYDENDTWRGRVPRRPEPPMGGGYSVRPPPQGMDQPGFESEEDYYFLKFGNPRSPYDEQSRYGEQPRYDEPVDDMYYDDEADYWDDEDDGVRPGEPRPAYAAPEVDDGGRKGPPANFGNFVAGASMAKTGYAPSTMKSEVNNNGSVGGTAVGPDGDEWGDEMAMNTGSMLTPRTNSKASPVNGSGGRGASSSGGAPAQAHFVVSEDQSGGGGRGKKGPPSNFGSAVGAASEMQTGVNPTQRSVEEEIANGGMATPTGMMATPRRKAPVRPANNNPAASAPSAPSPPAGGSPGQRTPKKPLFIVSEDDAGTPDFGASVAEASGARTGWAPKMPKRQPGGLEGGTTGGMRPKITKPKTSGNAPQRQEFGSAVFDACPTVDTGSAGSPNAKRPPPPAKQSFQSDVQHKHQRNPAVQLIDGGSARKKPQQQTRYSGTMMAPRIVRKTPPPQSQEQEKEQEEEEEEKEIPGEEINDD